MMKNILLTSLIIFCYLFTGSLSAQNSFKIGKNLTSKSSHIRVAIFNDDGVSTGFPEYIAACLTDANLYETGYVTGANIRAGMLNNFDVVAFPGGGASTQSATLLPEGLDSVRAFVYRGGGCLGICAGAYLVSSDYTWSLHILNTKVIDKEHWARGKGPVVVGFTSAGKEFFGLSRDTLTMEYMQGPLMGPAGVDTLPGYIKLGEFNTEIALNGAPSWVMIGTTAMAQSCFGRGRVAASAPHPEYLESQRWMVARMVQWLASNNAFTALTSPIEKERWVVGTSPKIQWLSDGGVDEMRIDYSYDNGTSWNLISAAATGSFTWTVPNTPSTSCIMRVISNNRSGMADSMAFAIVPPTPLISSLGSGNWNDPGTWVGGTVPISTDDVIISTGHTVTVNAEASCNNLSFQSLTATLSMGSATSVLNVHGNFTIATTTTTGPFSSWTAGAKLKFTGSSSTQLLSGWLSNSNAALMEVQVDKSAGKVTTSGTGAKWILGSSLEIINGTFELAETDDIYGHNLAGTPTQPTITVQRGGTFIIIPGATQINSGSGNAQTGYNPIGKITVFGKATIVTTSTSKINISGIDVESGGTLRIPTGWGSTSPNYYLASGVVTIKSGGTLLWYSTGTRIWDNANSSLVVNSGGIVNILLAGTMSLPTNFTDNGGTWKYSLTGNQTGILAKTYTNLEISGSGIKTLTGAATVTGTFSILGSASLALGGYSLTYGPSATLQYGASGQTTSQTTTNNEWPASGGPRNVQIYNSAGVALLAERTISGSLLLTSGKLNIGDNNLTIGSTSGASALSYVVTPGTGKLTSLVNGAVTYPIGTSASYTPLSFTANAANHNISVKVSSLITNPVSVSSKSVQLEWLLSESTPGSNSGTASFQWNASDAGVDFDITKAVSAGVWNGISYDLQDVTLSGSGPYTINYTLPAILPTGPIVIANRDGFGTITKIEDGLINNFRVFPNPFHDEIRIEGVNNQCRVRICSLSGNILIDKSMTCQENRINTQLLNSGVYIVTFFNEKGKQTSLRMVKK